VSNLDGFNTGASGNRYPIISRRTVTNRVNLRDGYTIALGGLVTSQVSKGSSKVPVLGDLPGLGGLFRSKSNTAESRNLIVFITARVIDPSGNLGTPASQENFDSMLKETVDPRMIRDLQVERFDLPGYKPDLPTFPTGEGSETSESAKKSDESEATVRTYQK
jgi:type II secretory pathway component GspD/PulD (secretin)